jgi:hypothetical protein
MVICRLFYPKAGQEHVANEAVQSILAATNRDVRSRKGCPNLILPSIVARCYSSIMVWIELRKSPSPRTHSLLRQISLGGANSCVSVRENSG